MMRLFLTGGTGFIGSHVLKIALGNGHECRALRRIGAKPRIPLNKSPEWLDCELEDVNQEDFNGTEVLIHMAAYGVNDLNNWEECVEINFSSSLNLLQTSIASGIKKFIIIGSCFEYGKSGELYNRIPTDAPLKPTAAYHASKAAFSMISYALACEHKLKMKILRPFHVYGEGEPEYRFWPKLRKAAINGDDFSMTVGEQIRDFVKVEEAANQILDAANLDDTEDGNPKIMNIGSGNPQSLRKFAEGWWEYWNAKGKLKFGDIPMRKNEVMRYVPEIDLELI